MNSTSDLQLHMPRPFRDRRAAGRLLATRLHRFANRRDVVILALPRGGVPVAYEVAVAMGAPLDVFAVRKLGVPGHEEFAMGAIGSGGAYVLNYEVIDALHIPHAQVDDVTERESLELKRREHLYRDSRPFPKVEGSTVILIDDGIATGASMIVAVKALRQKSPRQIVVAVPVAPSDVCAAIHAYADEVICYETPEPFGGVGAWYADFSQVTDDEVRALLDQASQCRAS
jgi:putative phosphoribosyl transferase